MLIAKSFVSKLEMLYLISIFLVASVVFGNDIIDIDDILNVDYMPGSLLLLEGGEKEIIGRNVTLTTQKIIDAGDGNIKDAYDTMTYHRKMMNEYLCRNFIADQILSDMSVTRIRRRLGTAAGSNHHRNELTNHNDNVKLDMAAVKDSLLADEGSANYQQWLTKSTTLEDIYRHYEQMQDRQDEEGDTEENSDQEEEYGGEVTGYAVPATQNTQRGPPAKIGSVMYPHSGGGGGYSSSGYGSSSGGHSEYESSGHGGGYDFTPHHVHYHQGGDYEESGKGGKDMILGDLFEIALTAIAFLSFGCFILEVIMCISTAKNSTTTMTMVTMMPMTMGGTADGGDGGDTTGADGDDGEGKKKSSRYKRNLNLNGNEAMNELARRVLMSIEAALVTEEDDGNCLRRYLCENNKYSRTLTDNQRIWIPVWSFGMSWLTGRINSRMPPATTMLDSLKASILGIGNADCKTIYNNCNLQKLREERKRRRRKRSVEK